MTTRKNLPPIFSRRPEEDELKLRYELYRIPKEGIANVIVTSHDMLGARIHFWNSRSQPCTAPNCTPCEQNHRPRWTGWLFVLAPRTGKQVMLEVTAAAAEEVDRYFREHRTLRGAALAGYRKPKKPNGRLVLQLKKSTTPVETLPKAPDLAPLLLKMWGVNEAELRDLEAKQTVPMPAIKNLNGDQNLNAG